jgi:hypothetical protein
VERKFSNTTCAKVVKYSFLKRNKVYGDICHGDSHLLFLFFLQYCSNGILV